MGQRDGRRAATRRGTLNSPPPPVRDPGGQTTAYVAALDEQRIARELKAFLHGRTEWPRHREFLEAGHKQLYGAVLRNGGTHKWARRMGVKKVKRYKEDPPSGPGTVSASSCSMFLAGAKLWPTSQAAFGGRPTTDPKTMLKDTGQRA